MRISQEDLSDLKNSPAGKALWRWLKRRVTELQDQWAEGRFNSENAQVCTAANVSAVTEVRLLRSIIDIDADELNEEEDSGDQKQLGVPPRRQGRVA